MGRVLIGADGEPALLIWVHVDDILVHGHSLEKVSRGLDFVMDTAVHFGLICQPVKTQLPSQEQKFCGFIYNTVDIPFRAIPTAKVGRALAVLSYVRHGVKGRLAKLSIAILAGLLQSFVPATPSNVGANYLRSLYEVVHQDMAEEVVGTPQGYYEEAHLTAEALEDLDWWGQALQGGIQRNSQVEDSSILSINFGDGSGTGSGGTAELYSPDGMVLQGSSWMGTWRSNALQRSSNYKELQTLLEFFLQVDPSTSPFRHRRLFYFTDNTTTYDVVRRGSSRSPGLHHLVRDIKAQELLHSTMLEVIHVPGTTMIGQGMDGLSRGLWITSMNCDPTFLVPSLFQPVPYSLLLEAGVRQRLTDHGYTADSAWLIHTDMSSWNCSAMLHRGNLWLLSPSLACQGMMSACLAWAESPLDSTHTFLIPRILQRSFGRVNKAIVYLGQFPTAEACGLTLSVPLILFHLPHWERTLPDPRGALEPSTNVTPPRWVGAQSDYLRGVLKAP